MLPNRPYVGTQIPNQPFHTPEEPATFDRLFGSLVPNIQLDPNPSDATPADNPWVRPADWLPLPSISQSQEKFSGLFSVYNTDSNFLAFTFYGDYTVNWGDGTTEDYNAGDKAQHNYSWGDIPASTLTSGGYRQVIVTVTPQSGSHLTSMDLSTFHDNVALDGFNYVQVPWLDISLSMPQADGGYSIYFGTYDNASMSNLEKVTIVNAGGAEVMNDLVAQCYNLGEFNLLNAPYLYDLSEFFFSCCKLKNVNLCDLPSAIFLQNMFIDCFSLRQIEMTGLNNADSFSSIFQNCYSLESVRMTGLTSAGSSLYSLMSSYTGLPNTRSLTLEDLNSLENLDDAFYDWGWDLRGHLKLTGLTGLTDLDYGLEYNYGLESVELYGLENATSAYETFYDCESLQSVKLEGTQNIQDMSYMFSDCYALEIAPDLDTSSVTDMYDMFEYCYSLKEVPLYDTSNVIDMDYMFYECYSLQTIPLLNTSSALYLYDMFYDCYSLQTVPLLNTSAAEDMSFMFYNCQSLQKLPELDVPLCTNFNGMLDNCTALAAAPLQNTAAYISYYNCCLSRQAIVDIFNGLANASETIDVSYNYGAQDLTAEDVAIAEDKGWTVYY